MGKEKEVQLGLTVKALPRYSPDLMPLDYSLWKEIELRMHAEEERRGMHTGEWEETFDEWKARLKKTALDLDEQTVRKAMGSMKRRCVYVAENDGEWVVDD